MEFDLVIVTARPQICALPEKFLCTFITPLAMFQETLSWTKNVGIAKASRQKNGLSSNSSLLFAAALSQNGRIGEIASDLYRPQFCDDNF